MAALEKQMSRQAVIDRLPGPDLFGQGRLKQSQIKVLLVLEAIEEAGRFFQGTPECLLGHAIGSGALDDHVAVDASIAKSSG